MVVRNGSRYPNKSYHVGILEKSFWCSPHNFRRGDGVASLPLLADMVSLHQLSQSGVTDGERRSPQTLAFLPHNGKADYLERGQLLRWRIPLLFAFSSLVTDLYQRPQGRTILFPQQNRLCTSGLGINHRQGAGSQ